MESVNGDLNIQIVQSAKKCGVKSFGYVSAVHARHRKLPEFVLTGYYNGKKRATESVLQKYILAPLVCSSVK